MKKILFASLCFFIGAFTVYTFLYLSFNENSSAATNTASSASQTIADFSAIPTEEISITETTTVSTTENSYNYTFRNAAFYCVETGEMLFSFNENERIAPASLAKLLTASVAYYYAESNEVFTVGTELSLVEPRSSLCLIAKGHRLTLNDLVTGLMLPSGNDAAYTIAVNIARKVSNEKLPDKEAVLFFCQLMNSFARLIGMENSNFTSPDGWDDNEQYTTVSDLLKLTEYALSIEQLKSIVSLNKKYVVFESGENIIWKNTNELLDSGSKHFNKYAVGVKTGSTKNAGNCLIAAFEKDGLTYLSVVCGTKTSDERYEETNKLFGRFAG